MNFDDVLHYELYFFVKRINQSICPSQYLLASTDDTTLWLTCFCSFSLYCSFLSICPRSLSVRTPSSSAGQFFFFITTVHILFPPYLKNIPPFSSIQDVLFLSLSFSLFPSIPVIRTSPCTHEIHHEGTSTPFPFSASHRVKSVPHVSNLPSLHRPRVLLA